LTGCQTKLERDFTEAEGAGDCLVVGDIATAWSLVTEAEDTLLDERGLASVDTPGERAWWARTAPSHGTFTASIVPPTAFFRAGSTRRAAGSPTSAATTGTCTLSQTSSRAENASSATGFRFPARSRGRRARSSGTWQART